MAVKILHKNMQCRHAVIFLLVSACIILGVSLIARSQPQSAADLDPMDQIRLQSGDAAIPDHVIREAQRLAQKEWGDIQRTFPERGYTEQRLESVHHVLTCRHVENEIMEVYGLACSYRSRDREDWGQAENAARSYLVFRSKADGCLEWIGDIRTHYEPDTEEFEEELHDVLMWADPQYLFGLLADESLEKAVEGSLCAYLRHVIPGDGFYFGWKQLAEETREDSGEVYGVLLFHTASGSPLIYSEETQHYVPAIYSTCLLPVRVSYEKDGKGRYVVTACWEPTEETYAQDIRAQFPVEAAELVLGQLDQYAADLLEENEVPEDDAVRKFFPGGPVWPAYTFHEALDDTQLCGLADYYPEGDIYYAPVHEEVMRRFRDDPVGLLNGLGACNENAQNTVCGFLAQAGARVEYDAEMQARLTEEGKCVYEMLEALYAQCSTLPRGKVEQP